MWYILRSFLSLSEIFTTYRFFALSKSSNISGYQGFRSIKNSVTRSQMVCQKKGQISLNLKENFRKTVQNWYILNLLKVVPSLRIANYHSLPLVRTLITANLLYHIFCWNRACRSPCQLNHYPLFFCTTPATKELLSGLPDHFLEYLGKTSKAINIFITIIIDNGTYINIIYTNSNKKK